MLNKEQVMEVLKANGLEKNTVVNDNHLKRDGYIRVRVIVCDREVNDPYMRRVYHNHIEKRIAELFEDYICQVGEIWRDYGDTTTHSLVKIWVDGTSVLARSVQEYEKRKAYYETLECDDPMQDILYHELRGMGRVIKIMQGGAIND